MGLQEKISSLFWKRIEKGDDIHYLYRNFESILNQVPLSFNNILYNKFINYDTPRCSRQEEFVINIGKSIVEPTHGFGIKGLNKIVGQTTLWPTQTPSLKHYLFSRKRKKNLESAIAYDYYVSKNYYHHFLNAVNSLHMLDKVSLPADIPVLIGKQIFYHPFFQNLYTRSEKFRRLNWVVQEEDEWYHVKNLYRMQCVHFAPEPWQKTLAMYNLEPKESYRKIFLSRDNNKFGRGLSNENEIAKMLESYGFETVYAEHLTVEQQTELFQTTKYLVALHGAGLVQQLFMNHDKAHIIEIFPADFLAGFYYWQAYILGIKYYDAVVGGVLSKSKNYYLELEMLEKAVIKMLDCKHQGKVYGNVYK